MIVNVAVGIAAGYGALCLAGGAIGYAKARSRASLIAGSASGLLLIGGAALATSQPVAGLAIASVVSAALVARFARAARAKRPTPVAYAMIGGGLAVLASAGAALL